MANAIFTGVSGLRANQQALEVVGNNLSNANTSGFKTQRVGFSDLFYQTLSAGSSGTDGGGGTNPVQTGFGVHTGAVSTLQTQGSLEPSGNDLDLGIQGAGFFVVSNGDGNLFTRAGAFSIDENNFLVDPGTGFAVQRFGTLGEGGGSLQAFQTPGDNRIRIPFGSGTAGQASSELTTIGNLSATAVVGATVNSAIQIFDTQGTPHVLTLAFTKTASNTWSLSGSLPAAEGTVAPNVINNISFGNNGAFLGPAGATMDFTILSPNPLPAQTITFNLGSVNGFDGLTQFGGPSSAGAVGQNGFAAGFLTSVSVAKDGIINGVFTNGQIQPLAQVAMASFQNANGLQREGNNYFSLTAQSGNALIGTALSAGRGSINQGTLEASNVDIALEFTRLIVAQRGFEINSRVITIANQVLQTLSNIVQ
jgi:flagellar hook protein FlgE